MESNPLGSRSELVGRPNLFNHSLHFLLAFGNIPEKRSGLGVNKCPIFLPWLTLNPVSPRFTSVSSLRSLLVAQVTCQRRARRTAGAPTAATSRSTAATTPITPWWKVTRSVRMKTPPPGVCFRSSWRVLCAGGLLQRHQSGLHRRSQRVDRFSDDRHRHPVPLPVSRACEMFLNVFSPHLERLPSSRPALPAFYRGFIVFFTDAGRFCGAGYSSLTFSSATFLKQTVPTVKPSDLPAG